MFKITLTVCAFLLSIASGAYAQDVIDLKSGKQLAAKAAEGTAQEFTDKNTGNRTVFNVKHPSITLFRPAAEKSNGVAVIVCPGGAFHILDIDNEGFNVAKILSEQGYTAILFKYSVIPLDEKNPFGALANLAKDFPALERKMATVIPTSIDDTKAAFKYVKDSAGALGIDPDKIGVLGFSAGGTLAAAMGYQTDEVYKPAFFAPIYPYLAPFETSVVPTNPSPMFIAVTEDDDFAFDENSLKLYQKWKTGAALADLHVYAKGRHGFGTKKQNLPVDHWMDRFVEWLSFLGYGPKK